MRNAVALLTVVVAASSFGILVSGQSSSTTPLGGCFANCACQGVEDTDSDGVAYDQYCDIASCLECTADCYGSDRCCSDYLEYCDANFRILTQFEVKVGQCKGTSSVTLGRTTECFGREDPVFEADYTLDLESSCILGCANRAMDGGYSGFAVSWNGGAVLTNCPDDTVQHECFCSLITGTIGSVSFNIDYRCYTTTTCSDGESNGEETGVDCGGIDCDPCPCSDVDRDGICDEEDSCPRNYFNDMDSDGFCAGESASLYPEATSTPPLHDRLCAATIEDDFLGDESYCAFSLDSRGQCSNDPLLVVDVDSRAACHELCVNNATCAFFAVASDIAAGDGGECFLYDQCQVFPTQHYTENLDIFHVHDNCFDNVKNLDEFTTDCSGMCSPTCSHCFDGIMNYNEEGTDCGGNTCEALCLTYDLVGDGYCLGHSNCVGSFCFETTNLDNNDWTCAYDGLLGATCAQAASDFCEAMYGKNYRGFSVDDTSISDCGCAAKCYHSNDINTFVVDAFLSETGNMECYAIATCSDGIQNGNELDVDCGGDLCSPVCDVDHDSVIDDDDSCRTDPENDIDGDGLCRDDTLETCPYRLPGLTTTQSPFFGLSNGLSYCQFTPVGKMCKSSPLSDDALTDYSGVYESLYPFGFIPRDMEEICYRICSNVDGCLFFSLRPGDGLVPFCQLHESCSFDFLLSLNDTVSFSMLETCFDQALNQNEESVDCGGVCEPICECEECATHSFVALDTECLACESRQVYDNYVYNMTECAWLCAHLGSACEAYDHRAGGDCHVYRDCGLNGTAPQGRRRRLHPQLPAKHTATSGIVAKVDGGEEKVFGSEEEDDNEDYVPSPAPGYGSPAPRALLATRRNLAASIGGDTTQAPSTDAPAPCNCCYQSWWKGQGPKASLENEHGSCRICLRDNCFSKFKCFDESGRPGDIEWICWWETSTTDHSNEAPLTTTPMATAPVTLPGSVPVSDVAVTTPTVRATTTDFINCGNGITAHWNDGSECATLYGDALALTILITEMVDSGTLVDSLASASSQALAAVTTSELLEDPSMSFFSDVPERYGDYNGVVEFLMTLSEATTKDIRAGSVVKEIRNAIADNCGLPPNSAHIVIRFPMLAGMRGRALTASTIQVGITLPISDSALTTTSAATGSCMLKEWCNDGVTNGDEDFVDCGGSCAACDPTCSDGATNGDEEDVDCGGTDCDPCPIDCVEAWADYGECSATCGSGFKTRTWAVSTAEGYGGASCVGMEGDTDTAPCNEADFVVSDCPIDCNGAWSAWSDCSRSCGRLGVVSRTFMVSQAAKFGGSECSIDDGASETASCNTDIVCPIDCKGEWSSWKCDSSCGTAVKGTRTFDVQRPARFGGAECTAAADVEESATCPDECCLVACDATLPPAVPKGVKFATVSGGSGNRALGDYAVVTGGQNNRAEADYSSIAGGTSNVVLSAYSTSNGGRNNLVAGRFAAQAGGTGHTIWGRDSFAMGHDTLVKNCQQSTAILGYQVDTAGDTCQFDSSIQAVCCVGLNMFCACHQYRVFYVTLLVYYSCRLKITLDRGMCQRRQCDSDVRGKLKVQRPRHCVGVGCLAT